MDDLQYFLSGFCRLPRGISQACIIFQDGAAPAPIAARTSSPEEENWKQWISKLFDVAREFSQTSLEPGLKASVEARTILTQFRNEAVASACLVDGAVRDMVLALPNLAARICTPLSLLHSTNWRELWNVPASIAINAVTLAKRFGGLQIAALLGAQAQPEPHGEKLEEEIMLAKVKVRGGRVRRRDLYRAYGKQASAVHDPVISRLIAKELLSQEGSNWLI
ncbi:MAG: hypothetical protein ACREIC_25940, partial [Limisphaerales bacterium]